MRLKIFKYAFVFFMLAIPADVAVAQVKINDVSGLNETTVSAIRRPVIEQDIQEAIKYALKNGKKISIAGRRHSQGGQIMVNDAIVLDMTSFNKIIGLNPDKTILTVQSGATWAQIQDFLNKEGLAVKVQQSSNIFTVGGSLSANIHGRDPRFGPVIETVRSFRLAKADGNIVTVSRTENSELFSLVIGGYGLFGVITEVSLEVAGNSVLEKSTTVMDCTEYPDYLRDVILKDDKIELHYARPDITAKNFMKTCSVTSYKRIADKPETLEPLQQEKLVSTAKWLMNLSRKSDWGKNVRWFMQDTLLDTPGGVEIITRNNAMRPPVQFLDYQNATDTDVLQEYFIPLEYATGFMRRLEEVASRRKLNVLNITLRSIKADNESFLPYVTQDSIAFVLYMNHGRDYAAVKDFKRWTEELINIASMSKGTYYLTYSNYARSDQIRRIYPMLDKFFEKKKYYDPSLVFMNKFFERYSTSNAVKSVWQVDSSNACPDSLPEQTIKWDNTPGSIIIDLPQWGGKRPVMRVDWKIYVGDVDSLQASKKKNWSPLETVGDYYDFIDLHITKNGPYISEYKDDLTGDYPPEKSYYLIQNNALKLVCHVVYNN